MFFFNCMSFSLNSIGKCEKNFQYCYPHLQLSFKLLLRCSLRKRNYNWEKEGTSEKVIYIK